jgi:histidinol-phosphatase
MNPEWKSRYDLAVSVAKSAGDIARSIFDSTFEIIWKQDESPVTVADRNAEQHIREQVAKYFPNDGFLGEEFDDQAGTSGFRWVVDPIDGTRAFVRGIPLWGTLVGLEFEDDAIAGVTYNPVLGEIHRALRGDGCYRNDRRIRVTDEGDLSKAMMNYSGMKWFQDGGRQEQFLRLCEKTDRQRGLGDYYGFVLVAQGSCEIMLDYGVHAWDVAALIPILEEAGGKLTTWSGERSIHQPDVVATNGKLHEEVLAILNRVPV